MTYYDKIAKKWHHITGVQGGAFKKYVLNSFLLDQIESIQDKTILELGAGNGYFMPRVLERYSGQTPTRLVISDISTKLLALAEKHFRIPQAEYLQLDVRSPAPFPAGEFDLVIATMLFNELTNSGARRGLAEIQRVLNHEGMVLLTITHPDFIQNLDRRKALSRNRHGLWTMPGAQDLRLPIVRRSRQKYEDFLREAGFKFEACDILGDKRVFQDKPGLRANRTTPLGLVFRCWQ
jgi:SAM-dependent methyltransferase